MSAASAFADAVNAFRGLSSRLERVSDTTAGYAVALRRAETLGLVMGPRTLPRAGGGVPPELQPGIYRQRAVGEWRALDRAVNGYLAVEDDEHASVQTTAAAVEAIAAAAGALAGAARSGPLDPALTSCSFCGTPADRARRVFVSGLSHICDRCVTRCVRELEDDYGEDWRGDQENP